ncbi:CTC-interacting domain 5, partial [Striga asiatica]
RNGRHPPQNDKISAARKSDRGSYKNYPHFSFYNIPLFLYDFALNFRADHEFRGFVPRVLDPASAMRTGSSSLNPNAAAYVPLFKRGVSSANSELNNGNEFVWSGQQPNTLLPQSQTHGPHVYAIQTGEGSKRNDQDQLGGAEFFASTSQYPNPIQPSFDEEFDMDLAYLQITFPGISFECDLDSAVDMLHQLEVYPDDSLDKLPDTLNIGDVSEPVTVGKPSSSLKAKNPLADDARASSSAPSSISPAS